jgi:hypothetical protein
MTPLEWLISFVVASLGIAITLFKKYYMPKETITVSQPVTTTDTTTVEAPNSPVEPTTTPKPTLADFLKFQWQFEGANPANNNPGNYRFFYGGYLPIYGDVKKSVGGFAVFKTLALGELYATNSTKNVVKNHPELTILTYLGGDGDWRGYAPASDGNNPVEYATFISSRLGVDNSYLMRSLVV